MDDRSEAPEYSPEGWWAAQELINESRVGTERLIASLTRLWDGVVEASAEANIDDEHDPEGATVAYERAQLRDALKQAHADLEDLATAAQRLRTGDYWVCERCGGVISAERLGARPAARTCITCASKGPR